MPDDKGYKDVGLRIGWGYDVHRLAAERPLILGGVAIPHHQGLAGHSDADVLTHAVMDALLGASGLGDIGQHFPDSDDRYKDISSLVLLGKVRTLLSRQGFEIVNIDVTLLAEAPRIAAHKTAIGDNLARTLGIAPDRVNVKATTTEGLGPIGRKEGMAAQCVVLVASTASS